MSIFSIPRSLSVEFEAAILTTLLLKVNVVNCVCCRWPLQADLDLLFCPTKFAAFEDFFFFFSFNNRYFF